MDSLYSNFLVIILMFVCVWGWGVGVLLKTVMSHLSYDIINTLLDEETDKRILDIKDHKLHSRNLLSFLTPDWSAAY